MQFDVYSTAGREREIFPYLVDVQSNLANQLANISASRLGKPLGNIARWRDGMVAAIDFMVTGI